MIECDEIITVMDIVSKKTTNIIATNITSTALINCHNKKVRDCYILHTVLLVILLLLIIIICYYYAKQKVIKMENNEFKNILLRIVRVIIFMT